MRCRDIHKAIYVSGDQTGLDKYISSRETEGEHAGDAGKY